MFSRIKILLKRLKLMFLLILLLGLCQSRLECERGTHYDQNLSNARYGADAFENCISNQYMCNNYDNERQNCIGCQFYSSIQKDIYSGNYCVSRWYWTLLIVLGFSILVIIIAIFAYCFFTRWSCCSCKKSQSNPDQKSNNSSQFDAVNGDMQANFEETTPLV